MQDNLPQVERDVTYYAIFTKTVNTYTIVWKDSNGNTLEIDENVIYGTQPSFNGEIPSKESTESHDFSFNGWTSVLTAVTENKTYTATFRENIKKFSIHVIYLLNEDMIDEQTDQVEYGDGYTINVNNAKYKINNITVNGVSLNSGYYISNITEDIEIKILYEEIEQINLVLIICIILVTVGIATTAIVLNNYFKKKKLARNNLNSYLQIADNNLNNISLEKKQGLQIKEQQFMETPITIKTKEKEDVHALQAVEIKSDDVKFTNSINIPKNHLKNLKNKLFLNIVKNSYYELSK